MKDGIEQLYLDEKSKESTLYRVRHANMESLYILGNMGATELYRLGLEAYNQKDYELSKRCEVLNKILNNCVIKSTCRLGPGTRLAYGGIGTLIHADTITGENCTLESGVTLASAPRLGDFVYIGTGARLISYHCSIGNFSIVEANAVVRKSVEPFTIVGGVPAKVIGKITPDNIKKYIGTFCARDNKNMNYIKQTEQRFLKEYYDKYQ